MHAGAGWRGALVTIAVMLCFMAGGASAARADSRHAAIVMDANTGRVLHAANADARRFPASLTKLMTLYLVFEQMEAGRLHATTPIRVSAQAASVPPSKLGLKAGESIPVSAAIRALVVKSANDVAVALAEHIAGNEPAFARAMTAKARQLGMRATVFRNAHGLPDAAQVTTARDMLTLSLALYDHFPQHARVFATRHFQYAGARYRNHNAMLGSFEGMEGIKTGYTRASGFNLSASVRRHGRHVVAVVMGGRTAAARNATMRTLLTRAIPRASTSKSRRPILMAQAAPPVPVRRPAQAAGARRERRAPVPAVPQLVEPPRPAMPPALAASAEPPPIHMARVRTVPVVPRQAEPAPWPSVAPAPAASRQMAALVAHAAAPTPPAPYELPHDGRGAKPSTLEAQARRLESGQPAVYASHAPANTAHGPAPGAYYNNQPPSYVGAVNRGDYAVQVGAFRTAAEAQARLREVRQQAGSLLTAAVDLTELIQHGSRTLYRARFGGLDAAPAAQACTALRRQRVDCFVARLN